MSTLLEKIGLAFKKKSESAKDRYRSALRSGDVDAALNAAAAAGIGRAQVESDAAMLEKARELAGEVATLPAAEKIAKSAQAKFDDAQRELDAARQKVAQLEKTQSILRYEAGTANGVVKSIRSAIGELSAMYKSNPDLLDAASAPPAVEELWSAEKRQAEADAAATARQRKLHDAQKHVEKCESDLHWILWGNWPFPRDGMGMFEMSKMDAMRNEKDRYAAEARQQVAEAKEALQAIEATAP